MSVWKLQTVRLSFQLSDWTLLQVALPLQVRMYGLADAPQHDPAPPQDPLWPGSRGYMMRAVAVSGDLPQISRCADYVRYVALSYRHYFIDMSGTFDGYRQKFSGKTRSTIARKVRKFAEHCGNTLRFACYRTPEEIRAFFGLAREVSRKTYQERLLDAGLPDDPGFLDAMLAEATQDRVRAFLLFDGERPVSYLFCPVVERVLVYAYLGYDPDYQRLSVGTVLQWLALEHLFGEQAFSYFDFTEGESEHKRLFATGSRPCANLLFLRDSMRNRILLGSHRAFTRLAGSLGALLEHWGLRARIRRILRFGA